MIAIVLLDKDEPIYLAPQHILRVGIEKESKRTAVYTNDGARYITKDKAYLIKREIERQLGHKNELDRFVPDHEVHEVKDD